jgi:hypothetical protein
MILHSVQLPKFKKLENTAFQNLDLFPSKGDGRKIPTPLGPLERAYLNQQWLRLALSKGPS